MENMALCSCRKQILINLLVCGICIVLIQLSSCDCLRVFTQSIYCMLVLDLLLALFHLRLIIPLHRFLPHILHIPCPTTKPYCKTREYIWCNTNPDDLSVCSNYFIADRRMDVSKYQWPGMLHQLFPQPCNVILKDIAIQTLFFPPTCFVLLNEAEK